jgi:hypothetical protein
MELLLEISAGFVVPLRQPDTAQSLGQGSDRDENDQNSG